jgi:mRNA interferase RelE/StbE
LPDFRVFESEQFQDDLSHLARARRGGIVAKLREVVYRQLARHPHFGPNIRKLRGYAPETWRYRIGAWRFFYEIDEKARIVYMIAASHRGSAY